MDYLLSGLTFVVVTWMIVGFIDPRWALRWKRAPDRGQVLQWGLPALVVLGVLFFFLW